MSRLLVAFACNDPDNGECRERFEECNVCSPRGDVLELERGWPMTVRLPDAARSRDVITVIRVGRRKFCAVGPVCEWYGNWCWDAIEVPDWTIANLLTYLRENGFTVSAGPTALYEAYSRGDVITGDLVRRELLEERA